MSKLAAITTRHWKSLAGFNLLVLVATIATVALSPRVWTATTQFILPDTTSHLDASLGTLGSLRSGDTVFTSQVNPLKVQASILTNYGLLKQVWARDPEKNQFSTLLKYGKLFKVSPQDQSTIISVDVSGSSPQLARQRALALTQAYQQHLSELRQADSATREQFSEHQLVQVQLSLTQAQVELARFKESTGLVNSEEQTKGIITNINNLSTIRSQALAQAKLSESRVATLSSRLGLTPEQAIRSLSLGENQDYQFVRQKLAEAEASLVEARSTYTDSSPKVQSLLDQRNELQRQLQQYVTRAAANTKIDATVATNNEGRASLIQQLILAETDASAQQRQAQQIQKQIENLNVALKTLPVYQAKLLELQRQYDIAEGVYKGLVAQIKQANIDAFNAYPNVQVLTPPTVDLKPSSPKLSLAALNAILASVFGSVALVLLLEGRNPLLSPKDLEGIKFPIVASIYRLRNSGARLALDAETETDVDFQRLASAVSLQDLKNRRLLIASAITGEGKTTVTLHLARALADLGFRVLVVDGDFRRAQLSQSLGYDSSALAQEQPVQIQPSIDLLPNLPHQSKILDLVRAQFEKKLDLVQSVNDYDYVLVDSAPVSLTSETALIAAFIPSVLFVVRPGVSKRNSVKDSLAQLTQHNSRIVGLVVNEVETKSKPNEYRFNNSLANSAI